MNSITIISIVVVALLTLIISCLTWIAFSSLIKNYKMEVNFGKHDKEIYKKYHTKKKSKGGLLGLISSWIVLSSLLGLFIIGIVYKSRGQNFSINNQVTLVIKSGSMSDFYDEEIASQYNYDKSLQFNVCDICIFDKIDSYQDLTIGDVYGYKYKNIIITHRLVSIIDDKYQFRGDNNRTYDGMVSRDNIIYHYTGKKIKGIGSFVLYAQSYFGLWSLVSVLGVFTASEIVYNKIAKIEKSRYNIIGY